VICIEAKFMFARRSFVLQWTNSDRPTDLLRRT